MPFFDEAQVEIVTVDYFRELGYEYIHGPVTASDLPTGQAGGEAPQRQDYAQVVLTGRLRDAMLPKLLSGEIELPEAEAITAEVSDTMVETAR
jgi:hypothetical protein